MPIQFQCVKCGRLLQVPDGTSGKQAVCQSCGASMTIPLPADESNPAMPSMRSPVPELPSWQAALAEDNQNPYRAPTSFEAEPAATFSNSGLPAEPVIISVGDALNDGAALYRKHLGRVLLATFIGAVIFIAVLLLIGVGAVLASDNARELDDNPAVVILVDIFLVLAASWIYLGQLAYYFKLARGETAEIGDLVSGGRYLVSFSGASILCWLAMMVGYVLCIIPGLMAFFALGSYMYFIVDKRFRAIESLKASRHYTAGNRLSLCGIQILSTILCWVLLMFVTCSGMLIFPLVALLGQFLVYAFWIPFMILVNLAAYLRMTGQTATSSWPTPLT